MLSLSRLTKKTSIKLVRNLASKYIFLFYRAIAVGAELGLRRQSRNGNIYQLSYLFKFNLDVVFPPYPPPSSTCPFPPGPPRSFDSAGCLQTTGAVMP